MNRRVFSALSRGFGAPLNPMVVEPRRAKPARRASRPRVYLERFQCFRTGEAMATSLVWMVLGSGVAAATWFDPRRSSRPISKLFVIFMGLFCAGYGAYLLVGHLTDRKVRYQITANGVARDGHLWEWDHVRSIQGFLTGDSNLRIECTLDGVFNRELIIATTPALNESEYEALARTLIHDIVPAHQHLEVNPKSRRE
jgi:hypothetical protein